MFTENQKYLILCYFLAIALIVCGYMESGFIGLLISICSTLVGIFWVFSAEDVLTEAKGICPHCKTKIKGV